MATSLKIANASAFWGDQPTAAAQLVAQQPDLDFITLDYLAEVSLSIMAIMRAKDPAAAYARDFIDVIRSLVPFWKKGGQTRIVTNAGGLDPEACAQACSHVLRQAGLERLKIASVTGDDVFAKLKQSPNAFTHFDNHSSLFKVADRLVTANAYLGADGIAAALQAGAAIVITGRVADPSLTVGPCIAHFGWKNTDYSQLAGATVAGHLIECGTQVCGGFSTDWLHLPDPANIGFPIAEIDSAGSCVITKPKNTGGLVNLQTVKEQLLYEIGDPAQYLSPDVTVSFLTIRLEETGSDRVRVSEASGHAPTDSHKVSATYRDGYKSHAMITVFGHDAVRKARLAGEGLFRRLRDQGHTYREYLVECLGTGASVRGIASRMSDTHLVETVLRLSVADESKENIERFTKEIASLVTCGPQGVTGYASGRPRVFPVFGYWPTLISKSQATSQFKVLP
ncbi:MAG TPA: acyclic terpene utilization AtuA family protein [Opitutaceae bacterium]|nr:acyclic terpene utilization AtuA family protein [Opitutaceae bacterium]